MLASRNLLKLALSWLKLFCNRKIHSKIRKLCKSFSHKFFRTNLHFKKPLTSKTNAEISEVQTWSKSLVKQKRTAELKGG